MSKKDLLERVTRLPSDANRPRREDDAAPRDGADEVTTRVGKVLRRRRADEPPEPAPAPPPVIRRRAAVVPTEPTVVVAPEPVAPVAAVAPVEAPAPVVVAEPVQVVAAPIAVEPPVVHAPVVAALPEPEPVVVEPVRAAPVEVEPPAPTVVVQPKVEEPVAAAPVVVEPVAEKPPVRDPRAPVNRPAGERPQAPYFPGLGSAVVSPPPGYDPTNPMAYRRRQEAAAAAPRNPQGQNQGPSNAPVNPGAGPGGPGATPAGRGRRRVEHQQERQDVRPARRRRDSLPGTPTGAAGPAGARPTKRRGRLVGPKASSPAPKAQKRKVKVDNVISVRQLAMDLGVKAPIVMRALMDLGVMAKVTDMLDIDTATLVANEFEYEVENVGFQEVNFLETSPESEEVGEGEPRPPVVTIMGHVDHGKTTLLDSIRNARVAAGEAGGITQHIGAYQVDIDGRLITFIDTPGHEAFTAMRARGAEVTDIVVLVVAADDGVQPQTEEAIAHARAAGVPIVVAVNKMDKAGVSPDSIMAKLSDKGLQPEAWGGETQYVPMSALRGEGIDNLLEALVLQADVLELTAPTDGFAEGIVLEAKMEQGRGAVATVLVQKGTLNRGDHVVLGSAFGKVRALMDYRGKNLKTAGPSTPVEVFGLSELPEVGDTMNSVKSEKNARALAEHRSKSKREAGMVNSAPKNLEDLLAQGALGVRERLLLVLKADVGGTLQALKGAIEAIEVEGTEVRILHAAVGDVSESDVNMAASDGALIVGFNTKLDAKARKAAQALGVEAEFFSVIYAVIDRIQAALKGMLAPVYQSVRVGTVEVRALFRISKIGTIAGSYVTDGKIARGHAVKVMRGGKLIWEGKVSGLKRFKDDAREVGAGYECGVSLDGFNELEEGDIIETYAQELVER